MLSYHWTCVYDETAFLAVSRLSVCPRDGRHYLPTIMNIFSNQNIRVLTILANVKVLLMIQQWFIAWCLFKLRSHMRGTVAERRRADFDIPAPLPRVCSHIRGADAGGSAISWGQWWFGARGFEVDAANWVLDPFLAERILLPLRLRSATAHVWTHVMICVEANFPPASARVRPRMCERTFRRHDTIEGQLYDAYVIGMRPISHWATRS